MRCLARAALGGNLQEAVGSAARGAAGICRQEDASMDGIDARTFIFEASRHCHDSTAVCGKWAILAA